MSGPKSSRYTLSPEQRKALMISIAQERARQERLRLAEALARAESETRRVQALGEGEKNNDSFRFVFNDEVTIDLNIEFSSNTLTIRRMNNISPLNIPPIQLTVRFKVAKDKKDVWINFFNVNQQDKP